MRLEIPKKEILVKTSMEDIHEFYYKPIFRYVFRKRLRMCIKLLGGHKFNRILDVGYGTGIFFFTLNKISKEIYGIDEHKKDKEIMEKYGKEGLNLNLISGDISSLPYNNDTFDGIVSISTLEHIKNLDPVINEFHRVLEKKGLLFLGFPVENKLTKAFLKLMIPFYELKNKLSFKEKMKYTKEVHVSSHREIINAVKKKFQILEIIKFPTFLPMDCSSYVCLKAKKL